jgi:hypothetical protein
MFRNTTLPMFALALSLVGCADAETCAPAASAQPPTDSAQTEPAVEAKRDATDAGKHAPTVVATAKAPVIEPPTIVKDADLYVKRIVIAHDVNDREPVDPASTFSKSEDRIYAFVEVGNRDALDSEIYVSFVRDGGSDNEGVRLRVGAAPRWRTWAYTAIAKTPGRWHAVVKNADGDELARAPFDVTPDAPTTADAKSAPAV